MYVYSQRDPQWASQRLGTVNGWTIGMYGCYTTAQAMSASHLGHEVDPSELDNIFTDRGLYVAGGLCVDGMLSEVYPDINYVGTYHCEDMPCDLNQLLAYNDSYHECILEVDFDHNPGDGIQTHFVRLNNYDPTTGIVTIDDPWTGETINFADRYGDPVTVIQKLVGYSIPAPAAPAAPTPPAQPLPPIQAPVEPTPAAPAIPTPPAPHEMPPTPLSAPVPKVDSLSSSPQVSQSNINSKEDTVRFPSFVLGPVDQAEGQVVDLAATAIGQFVLGIIATGLTGLLFLLQNVNSTNVGLTLVIGTAVTLVHGVINYLHPGIANTPNSK